MTTFALIHGAWHGAWCWELLTPELESRGHRVIAVDLPSEDVTATFEDYADIVAAALDSGAVGDQDDDIIAVGHSLGGHTLPHLALRRPLRHLVYLCGLVVEPGRSGADQESDGGMLNSVYRSGLSGVDGCTTWIDDRLAQSSFYGDCDAQIAAAAVTRLRPQAKHPFRQLCTLDCQPAVPSTYIVCDEDEMIYPDWSRRVAKGRLGSALVEFPGGHSPFYSRPSALADVLDRLE